MSGVNLDPKSIIEKFFSALSRGDEESILSIVDTDIIVDFYGPEDYLPWSGTWLGMAGFVDFLTVLSEHVDVISVSTDKMIGNETHVVTVVEAHWKMRDSGFEVVAKSSNIFTIRDGRILHYEVIADTGSLGAAFRGIMGQ